MKQEKDRNKDKKQYEAPAVIYHGRISTRAGSPFSATGSKTDVIDPADLFND